jgi:hypothetical protein
MTTIQFYSERNPVSPAGGINANPLRNDRHFKYILPYTIAIDVSLEHLEKSFEVDYFTHNHEGYLESSL